MRVFLDDMRPAPAGWHLVTRAGDAIGLLKTWRGSEISLDHDLGDDERGTGYDVLLWVEEAVATREFVPPEMHVHSANPPARLKMERAIDRILRFACER